MRHGWTPPSTCNWPFPAKVILSADLITKYNAAKYYVPDSIYYNLILTFSALLPGRDPRPGSAVTCPATAAVMLTGGSPADSP